MTDLFISYSRKNIAFVHKLHSTLTEHDLSVWVDWEGIPPSAEWLAEIYQAIEQADAFVFVLSAEACQSEVCQLELQHALKHNKRLLPIAIEDVPAQQVPAELARLNWLFFRDGDDFAAAVQRLLDTLKLDLSWLQFHTSLLNKALEWQKKSADNSLLLRGRELHQVATTLATNEGKEPLPTDLQRQFISTSRQKVRQRWRLGALTTLLILLVMSGVSWLAYQQYSQKQLEQRVAVIAKARAAASQAQQKGGDVGVVEAIQAINLLKTASPDVDTLVYNTLIEKAGAYRFAPRAAPHRRRNNIVSFTLGVGQLAFTTKGQLVGSSWREEVIRRWKLCPDQAGSVFCDDKPVKEAKLSVPEKIAIGIDRTGNTAAIADGKTLRIYALGEQITRSCSKPLALENPTRELIISPDRRWAAIFYGSRREKLRLVSIQCVDPAGGVMSIELSPETWAQRIIALAFHPDGQRVFLAKTDAVYVYSLKATAEPATPKPVTLEPMSNVATKKASLLQVSPDGRWLAVYDGQISLFDLQDKHNSEHKTCCATEGRIQTLQFNANSNKLAAFQHKNREREVLLWDFSQSQQDMQPLRFRVPYKEHDEPNVRVKTLAFNQDDTWLAAGLAGDNNDILLWPITGQGLVAKACQRLKNNNAICPARHDD